MEWRLEGLIGSGDIRGGVLLIVVGLAFYLALGLLSARVFGRRDLG